MKKKLTQFSCLLLVVASLSSCFTAKVAHGTMTTDSPSVQVVSKKNHFLINGLVPLNNGYEAKKYIGDRTNYVTKVQTSFVDGLLTCITFGLYTPTTTYFYIPVDEAQKK